MTGVLSVENHFEKKKKGEFNWPALSAPGECLFYGAVVRLSYKFRDSFVRWDEDVALKYE